MKDFRFGNVEFKFFEGSNHSRAIAIDTKRFRYWINCWTIEKFPIHHIDNRFNYELSDIEKMYKDDETLVFNFKKFWQGWTKK